MAGFDGFSPLPYNNHYIMKVAAFVGIQSKLGTEKGHKRDMSTGTYSLSALRLALKHLYEPRALQASPLVGMLGTAGRANAPALLRQTLIQAIESLKPEDDVPAQAPAWRVYEILYYRYVQQCSQEEVADQLGLSVRHLKREQGKALEVLAQRLGERFDLRIQWDEDAEREPSGEEREAASSTPGDELRWLEDLPPTRPAELRAALPAVLDLVGSIAARYGVRLQAGEGEGIPALAVHPVVLRQVLLSVLCVAIRRTAGGRLQVTARPLRWYVEIRVEGDGGAQPPGLSAEDADNLTVARQLLATCGGNLDLPAGSSSFVASLTLPSAEQVPVLVIDDHLDALRLLQRYASGTRYRVSCAQNAEQAFALARELPPQVIVLDVMMPEVDGWELLGRLKQHPLTGGVPIIACTILAQEELAYSLGVSAFLRKPLNRRDFLAALDRLVAQTRA